MEVVRQQLQGFLNNDTYPAFALASKANRRFTAPPDGENVSAFDRMVRTAFAPMLAADDFALVNESLGTSEGSVDALLYLAHDPDVPIAGYRFGLAKEAGKWRTEAVTALVASELSSLHTAMMAARQEALRARCFGASARHPSVQHSFGADATHNLCCALGPASRAYADASGNPIGAAAEAIDDDDPTRAPWSTCMGSNVCGYYGERFGDSEARFASSADLRHVAPYVTPYSQDCEAYVATRLASRAHGTPGIRTRGDPASCPADERARIDAQMLTEHHRVQAWLQGRATRGRPAAVCVINMNGIRGRVDFVEAPGSHSVRVTGHLTGLSPGAHGFHVHEAGDLTERCTSACAHLNPYGTRHGGPGARERHVGDLGNIVADEQGRATIDMLDEQIRLRRKNRNVVGRMLVVHADPDDLGKGGTDESLRTGNAGARVACGVIGWRKDMFV